MNFFPAVFIIWFLSPVLGKFEILGKLDDFWVKCIIKDSDVQFYVFPRSSKIPPPLPPSNAEGIIILIIYTLRFYVKGFNGVLDMNC